MWAIAVDFVRQGFEHILSGSDHLLFVFGLLLLVRSPWMLVKTITAFTIAHSITLAAATLGYVDLPAAPDRGRRSPCPSCFSASRSSAPSAGGTSFTIRNPWVVAFVFGLLHGFGFAGALSAAGLPPTDVPLALVSFNVGVEFGQLAFVAVVLLWPSGLRRIGVVWPRAASWCRPTWSAPSARSGCCSAWPPSNESRRAWGCRAGDLSGPIRAWLIGSRDRGRVPDRGSPGRRPPGRRGPEPARTRRSRPGRRRSARARTASA